MATYSVNKPLQSQINTQNQNYQNSQAYQNAQKWQNATINDVSKKYGFDYSQEYANRQAEVAAQAKRNATNAASRTNQSANELTMNRIDGDVRNSSQALDHNYFQQFLNQQQSLANSGLNAGMAQDANLRLGMNKQAQLADVFREANMARQEESQRYNNESIRLQEALGLIEQERVAQAQSLYQQLLQQGYQNLNTERGFYTQVDQNAYGRLQDEINRAIQLDQQAWERQMQEARLAAERSAARARSGGGSGGGSVSSSSASKASNALTEYRNVANSGRITPEDQYYMANAKKYPDQQAVANLSPAYTNMKRLMTIPSYAGGSETLRNYLRFN